MKIHSSIRSFSWEPMAILLLLVISGGGARAGSYDASNGVFGSGSYVGSDHWFASFTASALLQAAGRRASAGSTSSSGNAAAQVAREDAERGYFRIDPTRNKYPEIPIGAGYVKPGQSSPSTSVRSDADWIRPVPDGSFQRPVTDGSWKPPTTGPGYVAPQSDNSWHSPTVGPGYIPPGSINVTLQI